MPRPAAMRVASFAAAAAASLSLMALPPTADAHPLCYYGPDRAVSFTAEATFCPNEDPEGFCCEPAEEAAVAKEYHSSSNLSDECAPLYKEVLCGVCSPYSAHLYTRMMTDDGLAMTFEFCNSFVSACGVELALPATYCDEHVLDNSVDAPVEYWSYPLDIDGAFGDAGVTPAFPNLPEDTLPSEPIAMHMTPDGSAWWIAGMAGQIKMVDARDPSGTADVLDLSGMIEHSYEQGIMGFAFSPSFTETGLFFVSYVIPGEVNPENGINILSKFVYVPGDMDGTLLKEEVLITTSEKASSVHSSGWVGFAPSSYGAPEEAYHDLYWSVGDGGPQNDPEDRAQNLGEFHGSIVRISVPSALSGEGYDIPVDNPFDGAGGELPEICAWGFRNPHRCAFDSSTDALYCGDVGQDRVEEVNVVECGNDYGWRMFEGSRCNDGFEGYPGDDCAGLDRADFVFPVFEYCHFDYDSSVEEYDACGDRLITGLSVMGGYVYRGSKFADILGGHYIFADHSSGSLHHLTPAAGGGWTSGTILASSLKIVGFAEDHDGELYMIGYQGNIYDLPCGDLCESEEEAASCMPQSASTPTFEEVGCFYDDSPRSMTLAVAPACDGTMSTEICAGFCATVEGATHFGLQYQRECYCGGSDDDYTRYGDELDAIECNMPCSGSPTEMCGSKGKMNVYVITGEGAQPAEGTDPADGTTSSDPADGTTSSDPPVAEKDPADSTTSSDPPVAESSFPDNYVGCYGDEKEARVLTFASTDSGTMSMEECESFCSEAGATIFAMEHGRECFCGTDESDFEVHGPVDNCDYPCGGDPSTFCGGYDAMSVYTMVGSAASGAVVSSSASESESVSALSVVSSASGSATASGTESTFYGDLTGADGGHTHMGCYVDERGGRMLRGDSTSSSKMTPAKCRAFCSTRSHDVFNLQYGTECWCGDLESFAAAVKADDDGLCDYACEGDPSHRCGGYLYADVYKIV